MIFPIQIDTVQHHIRLRLFLKFWCIIFVPDSLNVFRRSGLKRPTYAPVPGLSSSLQPLSVPSQNGITPTTFIPENISSAPPNTNYNSQSYFKPIGVPPPTVNLGIPLSQPLPTYGLSTPGQNLQSPVMDAIPDSEVMESNIPGSLPSQYINNDSSTNVNVSYIWYKFIQTLFRNAVYQYSRTFGLLFGEAGKSTQGEFCLGRVRNEWNN